MFNTFIMEIPKTLSSERIAEIFNGLLNDLILRDQIFEEFE